MVWKRLYTLVAAVVFTIALAIFAVGTNYISDVWASLPGTNFTGNVNVDGNLTLTTPCANGYALDGTTTCAYTGTYDGDLNQDGMGKNSTNWTQMSTEDFITKGPVIDIRSYGAIPDDGIVDDDAIIAAVNSLRNTGGIIFLPSGTYNFKQSIYLNSSVATQIIIRGEGFSSKAKLNFSSEKYWIYVNQYSGGGSGVTWGHFPTIIVENMYIDGSDSAYTKFMYLNQAGGTFRDLYLYNLLNGVVTNGYVDNVEFDNINWRYQKGNYNISENYGWLYLQNSNGDGFTAKNIYANEGNTIRLYKTAGGLIEGCVGGNYYIRQSYNIDIRNCHFEHQTNESASITIQYSNVRVSNNYIYNTPENTGIEINDLPGTYSYQFSKVYIENNFFPMFKKEYNQTRNTDVLIKPTSKTRIYFKDNTGAFGNEGLFDSQYVGIIINTTNSTLNDLIKENNILIHNDAMIGRLQSSWEVIGAGNTPLMSYERNISAVSFIYYGEGTGTAYKGQMMAGERYYYRMAVLADSGRHSTRSSEVNDLVASNNSVMLLTLGGVTSSQTPFVLRLWRGTAAGTYDRYVDLLINQQSIILYDDKYSVSGMPWITTDIPLSTDYTSTTLSDRQIVNGELFVKGGIINISTRTSPPSNTDLGYIYVDSDSNELCFYNSTAWVGLVSGGACA